MQESRDTTLPVVVMHPVEPSWLQSCNEYGANRQLISLSYVHMGASCDHAGSTVPIGKPVTNDNLYKW